MERDLIVPGDETATLQYAIQQFIDIANHSIQKQGYFVVALSGGSTPKAIYQGLASTANRDKIDWNRVLLFWGDERCVPKDHPDSNYKMAMDAAFDHLPVKSDNIFPMKSIGDLEENALEYERLIKEKIPSKRFGLIMLGIGEDGHTASLFPHTEALHVKNRLVVPNFVSEKKVWRMTLTFDCINEAERRVVYVMGKSKSPIVKKVLTGPYEPDVYPIQRVEHAIWVLDQSASLL